MDNGCQNFQNADLHGITEEAEAEWAEHFLLKPINICNALQT